MNLLIPLSEPQVTQTSEISDLSPEALLHGRRQGAENGSAQCENNTITEQPWHDLAARCIAANMAPKETAEYCQRSYEAIKFLLRSPWFQERVRNYMEAQGQDILSLFKTSALSAYATIVEICEDAEAPKAVRVNAAKEILERVFGKAKQTVEVGAAPLTDPVAEAERLKLQIEQLRQQQQSL